MAGVVSDFIQGYMADRLREGPVVVWYDPDRSFQSLLSAFDGPTVVEAASSLFQVRQRVEPILAQVRNGQGERARVLVYVPQRQLPPKRNILLPLERLGTAVTQDLWFFAREALKDRIPDAKLRQWREITGLTLEKLDRLAGEAHDIGPLETVVGKVSPQELGLQVLADADVLRQVKDAGLLEELRGVLVSAFGVRVDAQHKTLDKVRSAFAYRVLLHEFLDDLTERPQALEHLDLPSESAQVEACRRLAAQLRQTRSLESQYARWAQEAEQLFDLAAADYDPVALGSRDTFLFEAQAALRHASDLLEAGNWTQAQSWIGERRESFWTLTDQTLARQWQVLALAVDLRIAADAALAALPRDATPAAWLDRYVAEDGLWCVDALLRRLAMHAASVPDLADGVAVRLASQSAMEVERVVAERFVESVVRHGWSFPDVTEQGDIVKQSVLPSLESEKVVLVLADALRYEMGRELRDSLAAGGDAELKAAIAVLPTITKIGMAALVPGAEAGLALVRKGRAVYAEVAGATLAGVADRRAQFAAALGGRFIDITLEECQAASKKSLEQKLKGKDLVVLRSQEIDAAGEEDNLVQAPATMGQVVATLEMAVSRLARLGYGRFVITADHGFLMRGDLTEAMRIEPPPGNVLELHRRCAMGEHLAPGDHYIVLHAADIGVGGGLDLAFPRGVNMFRTAGNVAYLHGGISPQEVIVPVLEYVPAGTRGLVGKSALVMQLKDAKRITNRLFGVVLRYQAEELFDQEVARRFKVVADKGGEIVGTTVQASHGFQPAGDAVALRSGEESVVFIELQEGLTGSGSVELRVLDLEAGEPVLKKKVGYDLTF